MLFSTHVVLLGKVLWQKAFPFASLPFTYGLCLCGMCRLHSRAYWAGRFCGDFIARMLFRTGSGAVPRMPFQAFGMGLCLHCLKERDAPFCAFPGSNSSHQAHTLKAFQTCLWPHTVVNKCEKHRNDAQPGHGPSLFHSI